MHVAISRRLICVLLLLFVVELLCAVTLTALMKIAMTAVLAT